MTQTRQGRRRGFTLTEVVVAAALISIGMGMALTGWMKMARGEKRNSVQAELDMDVRVTIERLRSQLRLTSLDKVMFFRPPGEAHYTAISFPAATDTDGDGLIELDANTNIVWDRTMVYHVWRGTPNKLLCTTFSPRDNSLTPAQVLQQLEEVVTAGDVALTRWASNGVTRAVFENLFEWKLWPKGARFDAYSPVLGREMALFGSVLLTPGMHTVSFQTTGKRAESAGYKIGLDYVRASASGSGREGEWQTIWLLPSKAVATRPYMTEGAWSDNYQLLFHATAPGQSVNFMIENDLWEESRFRMTGGDFYRTKLFRANVGTGYEESFIQLTGKGTTWIADEQVRSGGTQWLECSDTDYNNMAVRVLMKGSEILNGGFIQADSQYPGVLFMTPSVYGIGVRKTNIKAISLGRVKDGDGYAGAMDLVPGTVRAMSFLSGGEEISGFQYAVPNPLTPYYQIESTNTYAVTFLITALPPGQGGSVGYTQDPTTSNVHSYVLSGAVAADVTNTTWSTKADVVASPRIPCVYSMASYYPSNGTFTSGIFDTTKEIPVFEDISWNRFVGGSAPSGYTDRPGATALRMQVRSGNDPYLADAPAWSNVTAVTVSGESLAGRGGSGRYVQFRTTFVSDVVYSPTLRNVTLRWPGDTRLVDVSAMVTRGPDYGEFELLMDGTNLYKGIRIDLTIYKDVLGADGKPQRMVSDMMAEVEPRNTGR